MPNTRSYFKSSFFYLLIIYVLIFLIVSPEIATFECKNAIDLCMFSVVPVLFPFMVISELIVTSGIANIVCKASGNIFSKVFRTSKISQISFLCGTLFGFPLGAKSALSLYENGYIEKEEAERLICFCSNTGPGFVLGIVGSCLHNRTIATVIYFAQIASAIAIGLLLRNSKKLKTSISPSGSYNSSNRSFFTSLPKAITNSVLPTLNICAFVCFFSVIKGSVNEITKFFGFGIYSSAFVSGILEITNGIYSLTKAPVCATSIFLTSFFVGFSGLSVCMQTMSLASKTDIKTGRFLLFKLLQGALCGLFSVIICKSLNLY